MGHRKAPGSVGVVAPDPPPRPGGAAGLPMGGGGGGHVSDMPQPVRVWHRPVGLWSG